MRRRRSGRRAAARRRASARWTSDRDSPAAPPAPRACLRRREPGAADRAIGSGQRRQSAARLEPLDGRDLARWTRATDVGGWRSRRSARRSGAVQLPRHQPRFELEHGGRGADQAQERAHASQRSSRSPRRGPGATRHEAGRPSSASRAAGTGASAVGSDELQVRSPLARLSEPRARNRPRSHAIRQCSAAVDQSKPGNATVRDAPAAIARRATHRGLRARPAAATRGRRARRPGSRPVLARPPPARHAAPRPGRGTVVHVPRPSRARPVPLAWPRSCAAGCLAARGAPARRDLPGRRSATASLAGRAGGRCRDRPRRRP